MNFVPGGQLFPSNLVKEAELLLFIKMDVASSLPKSGKRLQKDKKDGRRSQKRNQSSVRGGYSLGAK